MLKKTLFVMTKNCGKGWRYDESQCFFNVKAITSFLLGVNIWSLAILIYGKSRAFNLFGLRDDAPLLKFALPVLLFLAITIAYPKRKVFALDETLINTKAIKFGYWAYAIATIILVILAAVLGKP